MKSLQALYELQAWFSGSMIAIKVPPEPWYKLRSSVREPQDTPHVTVVYMPDLQKEEIPQVRAAVAKAVEDHEPFTIKVDKISTFEKAKNSEGKLPHIALLEKKTVTKLRDSIVKELKNIRPDIVDTKFKVYRPHVTLQWVSEEVPFPILEEEVSWDVKDVRLYFKNAPREKFPLALKKKPNLQEDLVQEVVAFVRHGDFDAALQVLAKKKNRGRGKKIWEPQSCRYCDEPAVKAILHSNAYAFTPVCNAHVKRCKNEIDEYCGQQKIPTKDQKCEFCEVPARYVTLNSFNQKRVAICSCKACLEKAKKKANISKHLEPTTKVIPK